MSNKAIAIGSAEMEALDGLPMLQRWLYMVLRWHMDRITGRVGDVRGISLQSLAEALYVEPVRGRHAADTGSPSKKAVRSALDGLARAGLATPCGNGEVLVFFLPLARRASARQKDEGHMRGTGQGHNEGADYHYNNQSVMSDEGHDEGHTQNSDEGHTSRARVNPLSVEASAAALPPEGERAQEVLLREPLDADRVAAWIRGHEAKRGLVARVTRADVEKAGWIADGLTASELREVCDMGRVDREVTKNPAPLNVPFLAALLHRVRKGRVVCRGVDAAPPAAWHVSEAGIEAKAAEVGLVRKEGEPIDQLRGRVAFVLAERESQAKKARAGAVVPLKRPGKVSACPA